MFINNRILIGKNNNFEANLIPKMANRHGIICGASGSGKTVTLKVLAESFSSLGTPVFLIDVKGDLAGMCKPGTPSEKITSRLEELKINDFNYTAFPTVFWDLYGKNGHPIRTTVSKIGPKLISRMLNLTAAQEGTITIAFKIATDEQLELIDLKDLRALLTYIGDKRKDYTLAYGNINTQTIGAIQRSILSLQEEGGDFFFGKPDLDINDFIHFDGQTGFGNINILDAQILFQKPTLYACLLLWILTTTYNTMPEVGDLDKPKLVFFLDEAHLLFSEIPDNLLKQIIQIVKLIRSKGIGLYFISQSPSDIPNEILSQLGNKIEHVLRSYTPSDEKAIKAAANSFRKNPDFDTEEEIKKLATGEAIVSLQTEKGEPEISNIVTILPPQSMMGPITDEERQEIIKKSYIYNKYETLEDDTSAYEKITIQKENEIKQQEEVKKENQSSTLSYNRNPRATTNKSVGRPRKSAAEKAVTKMTNSAMNTIGRKIGNAIFKGLFKK